MVIFSVFRTTLTQLIFLKFMKAQYGTGMLVSQGVVIMKTGWACAVAQIKSFENQVCVLVFHRSEGP